MWIITERERGHSTSKNYYSKILEKCRHIFRAFTLINQKNKHLCRQQTKELCCADCLSMKKELHNSEQNNAVSAQSRLVCFCRDPEVGAVFSVFLQNSTQEPGFIVLSGGTDTLNLSKRPDWCPKALRIEPKEIEPNAAKRLLETCDTKQFQGMYRPRGMFFFKDGEVYIGIDNMTGDAWFEEFNSKHDCLKWLQGHDKPYYLS